MSTLTLDGILHREVTGAPAPGDMMVQVFAAPGDLPAGWTPIGPVALGFPFGAYHQVTEPDEDRAPGCVVWRPSPR